MKLLSFPTARHSHCNKVLALNPSLRWAHMDSTTTTHAYPNLRFSRNDYRVDNEKIVVIVGPTGSGKSRLSIDLATRFFPAEIINSDKIQAYRGLDVTTNKLPPCDRRGVPHHLLGDFDPDPPTEFTPSDFRLLGAHVISDIASRRNLPLVVGGSNSFIYALVSSRFDPETDVFDDSRPDSVCTALRYSCCFLWVDMSLPVLNQYLRKRVDEMFVSGMLEELSEYFGCQKHWESESRTGLRKAIGVPEFERYFKTFPPGAVDATEKARKKRAVMYEEAVRAIKDNTCELAKRQVGKILRLKEAGWELKRLDATEAFRAAMGVAGSDSGRWSDIWERQVVEPSVKIVNRFLNE